MFGFGGYSPFGMSPSGYGMPSYAAPQLFNQFAGSFGQPAQYPGLYGLSQPSIGTSPGPNGPPTTSGGFINDPQAPAPSGGFDFGGMQDGAHMLPGYSPRSFGYGRPDQPDFSNGRDQYGAVVPRPQDQPQSPWTSNGGAPGYSPGAYNPWMQQLGPQGAMGMLNSSPFTGYFNNMAFNNVGPPNYDPNTLNQMQSYAGLARHLAGASRYYNTAPPQTQGSGSSGPSPGMAGVGAGLAGLAMGNPYTLPIAGAVAGGKALWDHFF